MVQNPPASTGATGERLWLDPWLGKTSMEEEMATSSSLLAWKIPWTEKPGRVRSMAGSQRAGRD